MGLVEGKVAFVTGAGQGLGEGAAHALARDGASVVVAGRTFSKVDRVAHELTDAGYNALALKCDVSDRAQVDSAIAATVERFGTVDILINNAMTQRYAPFEEATEEDLLGSFRSSVLGTFNCMQACFPYFKEHGGKIVNFASAAGTEGEKTMATYAASKEAVRGLTKVAAAEWGVYGITVNAIAPMGDSPAWQKTKEVLGEEGVKKTLEQFYIKRYGDAIEDVGRVIVFLSSAYSDYMTGRTLFADGGRAFFH